MVKFLNVALSLIFAVINRVNLFGTLEQVKKRNDLNFYEKAMLMLERDEGRRAKPYRDSVGKLTIGVGRNLDDVPLSDDEIDYLLMNDIRRAEEAARRMFPYYDTYSEPRKLAILNMSFNLGETRFSKFYRTIKYIKEELWEKARSNALLSKWAKQVKSRSVRVTNLFIEKIDYNFTLSKKDKS